MDMNARGRKLAERMLGLRANGGQSSELTITRQSVASSNPVTGVDTYVTQTWTGSGFRTTFDSIYATQRVNIEAGDVRFLISPILSDGSDCPEPKQGDKLVHGGKDWNVVSTTVFAPAGIVLYYDVQGRAL